MPLSEHEQRLLDQMERAILTEDPRFASTFRDTIKQVGKKSGASVHPGFSVAGIVIGIISLIVAVNISQPLLGVFGFVIIVLALSSLVSSIGQRETQSQPKPKKNKKSFMQGFEERWDNRSDH